MTMLSFAAIGIVVDAATLQTMVQQAVQAAFMLNTQTLAHMVMQVC
jgi:hypothetical protein